MAMRARTRTRMGALFAFALVSLAAGRCLADAYEGCGPIPKYPAFMQTGPGSWRKTSDPTSYRHFPPNYNDPGEILTQSSNDSPETVRDWFMKTLPDWHFEDHTRDRYPPYWEVAKPNSNVGVVIWISSPPITITYKCYN